MSKKPLQILDPSFQMPSDYDDLVKVYRKAAKAADQRLVRLEQLSQTENFKGAEKYAYAKAQRAIQAWSGDEATRFNTKPPKSMASLKEKIQDIKTFLASSSSTKTGLKNVHMRRADSLNERYGTDYSWKQWDTFLNSKLMKKLDKQLGAGTPKTKDGGTKDAVIAAIVSNKEEIVRGIEEQNEIEIYTDDEMVDELVQDIVSDYSEDVMDALGVRPSKQRKRNRKNKTIMKGVKTYKSKR
jgi:hypothetical protein